MQLNITPRVKEQGKMYADNFLGLGANNTSIVSNYHCYIIVIKRTLIVVNFLYVVLSV